MKARLPGYIAAKHAEEETGIPYSTLRTAHFNGELPALRVGKEGSKREAWYFRRDDLLQWLERHTHHAKQRKQSRGNSDLRVQRNKGDGVTFDDAA
jgi:hypothetical protein